MLHRFAASLFVLPLLAMTASAQGLETSASKTDWEEINFEYNSSVLSDGYPSLLRLAELLHAHTDYKVKVEGHTDTIGGADYNDKLGLARATTVKDFLVKYGASAGQIEVATRGKVDPKYPGQKPEFTKTDVARWMNRRVVLTVMDGQGRVVGDGGVAEAIRAMEPPRPAGMADCCNDVLRRLDEITQLLKNLADQNAQLKAELDGLKQNQQVIESKVNQPPMPGPTAAPTPAPAPMPPAEKPHFETLAVNLGMDQTGNLTMTGNGRFFMPFEKNYAFQANGEVLYFKGQKEGQFDFGLIDRIGNFQAGLFSSFKHVDLSNNQYGATLGEASLTLDYIFRWGKLGAFATQGFMNNVLINRVAAISPVTGLVLSDVTNETYLHLINQYGAQINAPLWGNNYLEGNVAALRSEVYGTRAGATIRLVFPLNHKIAVTVEGDINETLLSKSNTGAALIGLRFGDAFRPKEMQGLDHPVPVEVPRIRYEEVLRVVRTGDIPPVANAGPDQIGVPAGTITLNGSASYSPEGNPITFSWVEDSGPPVALTAPTSAITTFQAAPGQTYSFLLTVRDNYGGQGQARVRVTTNAVAQVAINYFIANPPVINQGQASTLSWQVVNATSVMVSTVGTVSLSGSSTVTPATTTTYTITAVGSGQTVTATTTVVVNIAQPTLAYCYATPTNIILGESATLNYQALNATSVSISGGVNAVGMSGSVAVTPTTSTTYTITATGAAGTTPATCSIGVTVTLGNLPRIIQFSASPMTIMSGQTSNLLWVVENATSVNISTIGTQPLAGTTVVSPAATTTYVLTATNQAGSVTAQATVNVNVIPLPTITSFTANPAVSPSSGSPVVLTCATQNAASVTINGITYVPSNAHQTVYPTTATTYNCIATNSLGQTATATVTVTLATSTTTTQSNAPVVVLGNGGIYSTPYKELQIDASGSYSPVGNTPLTYFWVSNYSNATILNPTSPTPTVELGGVTSLYTFTVTVTDSKGNSTQGTVIVNFVFPTVP